MRYLYRNHSEGIDVGFFGGIARRFLIDGGIGTDEFRRHPPDCATGSRCRGFRTVETGDRRKAKVSQTGFARYINQNVILSEVKGGGDVSQLYSLGKIEDTYPFEVTMDDIVGMQEL